MVTAGARAHRLAMTRGVEGIAVEYGVGEGVGEVRRDGSEQLLVFRAEGLPSPLLVDQLQHAEHL